MSNRLIALMLAACLPLSACVTVENGHAFDSTAAANFKRGEATRSQIEATLGTPNSVTELGNGMTVVSYFYSKAKGNGFVGKTEATGDTFVYTFDANGVLRDVTHTTHGSTVRY